MLQVTSRQALQVSSERFASLQQLIDAIPTATDPKAILDLQARIAAEQAMLQNEQTKLDGALSDGRGGRAGARAARARARDRAHRLAAPPAGHGPERLRRLHADMRSCHLWSLVGLAAPRLARKTPTSRGTRSTSTAPMRSCAAKILPRARTIPARSAKTPIASMRIEAERLESRRIAARSAAASAARIRDEAATNQDRLAMGFFAEFNVWLNAHSGALHRRQHGARLRAILEPAIVTLGVFYVMVWGYLQLMGKIEEPFVDGVKRLLMLALILGVSLQLWLYNDVIVDTFFRAPRPSRPASSPHGSECAAVRAGGRGR